MEFQVLYHNIKKFLKPVNEKHKFFQGDEILCEMKRWLTHCFIHEKVHFFMKNQKWFLAVNC